MEQHQEPSKTQRKREMHALQALGETLAALPLERLAQLDLPEVLRDALMHARQISKWGARRRQMQYIGKLMREVDATAIRNRLDAWQSAAAREASRLHQIERWRDRLLENESALGELLERHPRADVQRLRSLIRNAR
ncbi:MAG: ribosome biogenesis factor YjgA, partial [Burkholderiales bacterium]